jgi:hypothetical protein
MASFGDGADAMGLILLQAHYAVVPEAHADLAKKMTWFPALSRPALAPRIGIAVQYMESSSKNFRGSPMPIGSPELKAVVAQWKQSDATDRGIGGNRRASRFDGGGAGTLESREADQQDPVRSASGPEQLTFYTGDFGEIFLDALQERFEAGEYGLAMQEILQEAYVGRRPGGRANGARGSDAGDVQPGGEYAGGQGELNPEDQANRGPGSRSALDGLYDQGGRSRRFTSAAAAEEAQMVQQVKQIMPCVLWLGKEVERDKIMKLAEMAAVDLLVIFEMTVREARGGDFVSNQTKVRLVMTKGNKPVAGFASEPLVNDKVEQWRQKDQKGIDPVEREVTKIFTALDGVLKPTPLPAGLTAERATKRIMDLVAEKPQDPLAPLVEARFYVTKGLLSEGDFRGAAIALLGQKGFAELQAKATPQ